MSNSRIANNFHLLRRQGAHESLAGRPWHKVIIVSLQDQEILCRNGLQSRVEFDHYVEKSLRQAGLPVLLAGSLKH